MEDLDDEPGSLPCSAEEVKFGWPVMVQLQFVDAGLEKNPYPREDFYRQYSVTPEQQPPEEAYTPSPLLYSPRAAAQRQRKTPEEEQAPPPCRYSPRAAAQRNKDWAQEVAKDLKQFYAGRVLLRTEEAGRQGDFEGDAEYWDSKADHWEAEMFRLSKEMGNRVRRELEGEAEEGYAKAMLFSPLQSPSSTPLSRDPPEVAQSLKSTIAISNQSPENTKRPSRPQAVLSQQPPPLRPGHSPDQLSTLPKGQKRTCNEIESREEETLEDSSSVKRQKQEPVSVLKSTQSLGKKTMNASQTKTKKALNMKGLLAKAPVSEHHLPWKLRSRNTISYREIGMRTNIEGRDRKQRGSCIKELLADR